MKRTKFYLVVIMMLLGMTTVFGDSKTEQFKVFGNCGMCESRIEKAAGGVDGVVSADWDKETKQIVVEFDDSKTTLQDIHKAIAKAGYDTELVKAEEKDYKNLPSCCQYDRTSGKASSHEGHQHDH